MKDVQLAVRAGYIYRLKNQLDIIWNGQTIAVPILDRVSQGQPYPYVHIAQQQTIPSYTYSARGCLVVESSILLNVYTSFLGNAGGKEISDRITAKIFELVLPYNSEKSRFEVGVQVPNEFINDYRIFDIQTEVTTTGEAITKTETEYEVRRSIRFRNIIQQF